MRTILLRFFTISAATTAARSRKNQKDSKNQQRKGRWNFAFLRCNVCSLSFRFPLVHARLLSSYRFSLASPFLFYFWLSVSVRSCGNPGTRSPSKDASRHPRSPPLGTHCRLPSQCLLRLLLSCSTPSPPASSTFILHRITSGDDGIPDSFVRVRRNP